jgi:hypothetical protein
MVRATMTSQCDTKFCQPTYTTTGNSSGQWGSFSIAQTAARSQQCHLSGGACAPNPALPNCQSHAAGTLALQPDYFALENGNNLPSLGTINVAVAANSGGSMDGWYADIYEGEHGSGQEQWVTRVSVGVTCTLCT